MSAAPYLIEAAVIAPTCLALGFVGGVKYQHHKLTREVAMQARGLKRLLDKWGMFGVGVFVIVATVLTYQSQQQASDAQRGHYADVAALKAQAAKLDVLTQRLKAQSACLIRYANGNYDSLEPRQKAAKQLQAADNRFNDAFVVVLNDIFAAPDPAKSRADALALKAAASAKQMLANRLNAERAKNPYPPPPKKVCPK